jgi:hypothetical protein
MRKLVVFSGLLAVMVVPAIAQADRDDHPGAVQFCQAERARIGVPAFRAKYANRNGKHAFARCVAAHVRERGEDRRDARRDCTVERNLSGVAAFRAKYGQGPHHKNAYARCVQQHKASERAADRAARDACTAQRNQLGVAAFREQWGTGPNDRRAFARCVDGTEQDNDSPTPQS